MALSIKDEAIDRVVRRYAALRRTSYTQAIKLAVTEALEWESESVNAAPVDFVTFARDPWTTCRRCTDAGRSDA